MRLIWKAIGSKQSSAWTLLSFCSFGIGLRLGFVGFTNPIARHLSIASYTSKTSRSGRHIFPPSSGPCRLSSSSLSTTTTTKSSEDFLHGSEKIFFRDINNLNSNLSKALENCGKPMITSIQQKVLPLILSGKDLVIGAETGSGKTLAYLIPLIQKCLESYEHLGLVNGEENKEETGHFFVGDSLDVNKRSRYPEIVVMVPNKELCLQVHRMASELVTQLDGLGCNVKVDAATNVVNYWTYSSETCPNILICTPSFLSKFVKGPVSVDEELFRSIKHLVLDEADMLLEGSYLNDVEKILEAFKVTRRAMIRNNEIAVHESVLQNILVAATLPSYGLKSIEKYIENRFPHATFINNDYLHKHHPRITQTYYELDSSILDEEGVQLIVDVIQGENIDLEPVAHIADISKSQSLPTSLSTMSSEIVPTMIFVNTAQTCSSLAESLKLKGLDCAQYHKLLSAEDKIKQLQLFREGKINLLVCTDHAARGFDLPNVRHVIQGEFALNVVQHLHRIGRASRAGALGKATNFFNTKSMELVKSILSTQDEDRRVTQAFSRRRGFRQRNKRRLKNERSSLGEEAL